MITALVWNDAKSFKLHLEHMRMFRQTHRNDFQSRLTPLKCIPTLGNICPPSKTGGIRGSISTRSKSALVPMWEIVLPRNSQN